MDKKICFYTVAHPKYVIGGAELQTYNLANEFAKRGWDVYFLTRKKEKLTAFSDNNSLIKVVEYSKGGNPVITVGNIFKKLVEIKPKYIYFRNHTVHLGTIAIFSVFFNSAFFWATMHDDYCDPSAPIKKEQERMQKGKNVLKKFFWKINLFFEKKLFLYGVKRSNGIIVQNKIQEKIVKENFAKKRIIRIYNGHQIYTFVNEKKYDIIFVATLKDFKRPELFFDIVKKVKKTIKVAFVGRNFVDKNRAAKILKAVNELNIDYYGEVDPQKVLQLTASSKVLVNTSITEGFPNTFIQAWMLGVPVVSLKVDPDDLIKENHLGIVCNDNLEFAAKKIEELLNNEHEYSVLSSNCKRFAIENFDIKKNSLKLEKFILDTSVN